MNAKLLVLWLIVFAPAAVAQAAGPINVINVAVVCKGKDDDTVGRTICFKLKERIQASVGFRLIKQPNASDALTIHIVHVSTSPGLSTALSTVVTIGPRQMMIDQIANIWGSQRINDAVDSILDDLDEDKEDL